MTTKQSTILETGFCECKYEPRGDHGLEGYQRGDTYKWERKQNNSGEVYFKVFPYKGFPSYGETCSKNVFNKHFSITQFQRIAS